MIAAFKPSFEVKPDLRRRIVYTKLTGIFTELTIAEWAKVYRQKGTNLFAGRSHMCVADMRGMRPSLASVNAIMGAEIAHSRQNGIVLCAHITDDVVQRLQMRRIARQNSPRDDVTVEVCSLEEAYALCEEARAFLDDERVQGGTVRPLLKIA